jgi:hypothetical protein
LEEYGQLLSAAAALEAEERKPAILSTRAPLVRRVSVARKAPVAGRPAVARRAPVARKVPVARKAPVARETPAARKAPVAAKPAAPAKAAAPKAAESRQAIVAALEHGSHTVAELAVVTAMSGPSIRETVRGLLKAGRVTKTKREGKAAYALAS